MSKDLILRSEKTGQPIGIEEGALRMRLRKCQEQLSDLQRRVHETEQMIEILEASIAARKEAGDPG